MALGAVIVIPALNPPASLVQYAGSLIEAGFRNILVVNDGSRTDKLPVFFRLKRLGCTVLEHEQNRGQGAALRTGFQYYREHFSGQADGIITINCDRLIDPEDVRKVASSLHNEQAMGSFALVVGTRDLNGKLVSDYDYRMGGVMKLLYHMLMGVRLNDPLSGVFGIPDMRVEDCIAVEGDGYAYETAMTMSFEKVGFLQVPIGYAPYADGSERKYHKGFDTVRILYTIFKKFILYSITSVSASVLDVILFSIFTGITFRGNPLAIIYGTVCARVISASVNYLLTKRFVFHFKSDTAEGTAQSAGAFMALTAAQCICSALIVSAMKLLLGGNPVGFKVFVDVTLFFVSYKIQHKYIFKDEKTGETQEAGDLQAETAQPEAGLEERIEEARAQGEG